MKKILLSSIVTGLLLLSVPAQAQHQHFRHGHWHRAPGGGWYWVPALIIGGVAGAAIARETLPPPVILQQQPVTVVECTEWKEIQTPEGKIYRERSCTQKQQ